MTRRISIWLLLLLAVVPAIAARLETTTVPVNQIVALTVDPDQTSYKGTTRIGVQVTAPVSSITLHAEEMTIRSARLEGKAMTLPLTVATGQDGLLTVKSRKPIVPGLWVLRIEFENEFDTRAVGLYRMTKDGAGYAFTQFEAVDARKAFPCFDEPGFKIPFQIRLRVRKDHVAVTNTPVQSETVDGDWKDVVFRWTPPLPSYLIAIAVGPLDSIPIEGLSVPGRIYALKGQAALGKTAAEITPPLLDALERWFGTKYPYEKLDLIAIADYWPGAMEHPGAITFADGILLLDPAGASANQKRRLIQITAHELAHMWFGDLVTMKWWDDLWLNESFADWMGDKITHQVHPQYRTDLAETAARSNVMTGDARPTTDAIRKPVTVESDILGDVGIAYDKGKTVLGMFERWIGPARFRKGVNDYLRKHSWGNTEASDFFTALSAAAGSDIGPALNTFLDQPGLPLIEVRLLDGNRIELTQRRMANYGVETKPQQWVVPVNLKYSDGVSIRTRTVLLDAPAKTVELEAAGAILWIAPNADAAGYYRWSVDPAMLRTLAAAAVSSLSAAERIDLVNNAAALLDAGRLSGSDFMRILESFGNDPEPRVISSVMTGLNKAHGAFVTEDLEKNYAVYVGRVLGPARDRFGMEPRAGEDETITIVRPQIIGALGHEGRDPQVLAFAQSAASRFMKDPRSVDSSIVNQIMQVANAGGNREQFEEHKKRFLEAKTPAIRSVHLSALASIRDLEVRKEALGLVLSGSTYPNEMFAVVGGVSQDTVGRNLIFDWVTTNYDQVAARIPPLYRPALTFIGGGCEKDRLDRARVFFSDPARNVPGTDRRLEQVTEQVMDCVGLRQREGAGVAEYLEKAAAGR